MIRIAIIISINNCPSYAICSQIETKNLLHMIIFIYDFEIFFEIFGGLIFYSYFCSTKF